MNQQLSAILSVQQAPGANSSPAPAAANGTLPSFAETFTDVLGDQGPSDAVLQALLLPVTADASVLAATAAGVSPPAGVDDGNVSPENGTDLPLLLQLLDSTSTLTPGSGIPVDTQNAVLDVNQVEVDPAVQTGWPMTSLDAQWLAANTLAGTGKQSPAGSQGTAVSAPGAATLFATNPVNAGLTLIALAGGQQAQTALNGHGPAPQHSSPYDLELSTLLTSVLLPVKGASIEQFNLAVPATLETSLPDTPSVTTSAIPLNSAAGLTPNITTTPSTTSGKFDLAVPQAPGQPGWSDVFAERVSFAVRQSLQEAEIRLNPPSLGQVDVRIVMHNDQANLMFSSPHSAVRDAIEASMGRLRDMLADSGFSLVNVDVSGKSLAQQRDAREQRENESSGTQYSAEFELAANAPEVLHGSRNIDYYI